MIRKQCHGWYEGDALLETYHANEWCKVIHDDQRQFELLCLEGASVGLSWKTIIHKRDEYRRAFSDFDIETCAAMTDDQLEHLLLNSSLIRNRSKIFSVRKNAQAVQQLQKEFGSFDSYIWGFTDGQPIDHKWQEMTDIPSVSSLSLRLSQDMKKRGISFVGPIITYSFLQAIGVVNDHLKTCPFR